uniref:Translation initiation factor IF-2, chloroplastic n=1 Tax=Caloglossa beccarii TaxID=131038 RepID=A0A1Z1M881_9FLOR|nr:translation initiation factor 2 [Caloglossa beccarii]ARW62287.1 translation initiation factor 2 [Caloglossa beccarii]
MSNIVYSNEILYLRFPKLLNSHSNIISQTKNLIGKNLPVNTNDKDNSNKYVVSSGKFEKNEKKNKHNLTSEDILESKKNKVKLNKKVRKNAILDTDDLLIDDSGDLENKNVNSYKANKYKKKNKGKNFSDITLFSKHQILSSEVVLNSPLNLQDLSVKLNIPEAEIIKYLFLKGISVTINDVIDVSMAKEIALHYNFNVIEDDPQIVETIDPVSSLSLDYEMTKRAPVITIFGHVDHGKTTLLDAIMKTHMVKHEYGGITQAISGYEVEWEYEQEKYRLVFLDTPGHEAFTSMRLRGAKITDIALLIIAADDGLKPQSIESIEYILKMKLAHIVVINKIDKADINILKIKQELANYNMILEEWGGNTKVIEVSALTGKNIDNLLSTICLLAKLQNYVTDFTLPAKGTILEAYLDKKKGIVTNALIQQGTLKVGDVIVSGKIYGKVKSLLDINNQKVTQVYPLSIIKILAFSMPPESGSNFLQVNDEKKAKQLVYFYNYKNTDIMKNSKIVNRKILVDNSKSIKQLNLILKTDTQGTLEALFSSLAKISQNKVQINLVSASVGNIVSKDIELALAANSIIVGFHVDISNNIISLVKQYNLSFKIFYVIYDLLDYIQECMLNLVDIEYENIFIGSAIVQTIFAINKGSVAGCIVNEGSLKKMSYIYVYQGTNLVYDGFLISLKRMKTDVDEVLINNECGIMCNYNDWKVKDIIKAYDLRPKKKTL